MESIKDKYYKELKDLRWKTKRSVILNRDKCCVKCNSMENLQVHHIYYEKFCNDLWVDPWDYPDSALITLCEECHLYAHNNKIPFRFRRTKPLAPGAYFDEQGRIVAPSVIAVDYLNK